MTKIFIDPRYEKPIKDGAIHAVIQKAIGKVKVGDIITFCLDKEVISNDIMDAKITKIERLRIDELNPDYVLACGYTHIDIFEDHIADDFGVYKYDGILFYYIEFELLEKKDAPYAKINKKINMEDFTLSFKEALNTTMK